MDRVLWQTLKENINVYCFQVISNETNLDYLFQSHQQYNKKIKSKFFFLMTPTTIFIEEKTV